MERYDLVLGGGGVRGTAHVGVVAELAARGLEPGRVAGASAGALVGALLVGGATPERMQQLLDSLDYRAFALADLVERLGASKLSGIVDRLSPETVEPLTWIREALAAHAISTWADLADPDPAPGTPPEQRYRLMVRCLDVVHKRVLRLPWDYHRYGLRPEEQSVAEAVRASMSVPLVFEPVRIGTDEHPGLLVDGGIGSGLPVTVLDRRDGRAPRWPTFGVRLLPRVHETTVPRGDVALLRAFVATLLAAGDASDPVGPRDESRTVAIDTSHVLSLDVRADGATAGQLHAAGRGAMSDFLDRYDHREWVSRYGPSA